MHGGNIYQFAQHIGCEPNEVLDFSANINPVQAVNWRELAFNLTPYAEPTYQTLTDVLKQRYALSHDLELFNGASAAIFALLRYLKPKDVVLYAPLYNEYSRLAKMLGCNIHIINRLVGWAASATQHIPEHSTVIFVNPATPDGTLYDLNDLLNEWQNKHCHVIVDESFLDFTDAPSVMTQSNDERLYLIKSLSKFYGCAGVRVGFVAGQTEFIKQLRRFEPAWKLSTFDMAYIEQAMINTEFIAQTQNDTLKNRALLKQALQQSERFAQIYNSAANFLLARLPDGVNGHDLQTELASSKILIRVCDNFLGLDERFVRFAVKDEQALTLLAEAIKT